MQPAPNTPTFEVTLTSSAYGGDAIGRLPDGRAVFIPYGIPGEVLRIHLTEEKARFARGELVEIVTASSDRIAPRCPHFSLCGGCHYQHVSYERQLEMKSEILRDQLERIGGFVAPPIEPVLASPRRFNYRNHIQFHLLPTGELGFYRARSGQTFPVRECHLPAAEINAVWPQLDIEYIPGMDRIGIRSGEEGDVLLVFEASNSDLPEFNAMGMDVSAVFLRDGVENVLAGNSYSVMQLKERFFRVSAGSFFQVNSGLIAEMVDIVENWVASRNPQTLLEVYAGVGLFSAFLAPHVSRLAAIEVDPGACDDFAINLDEFDHVELYQGLAEDILPDLDIRPEIVLVDPPRSGLGENVLQDILDLSPGSLIYISCDPATLARDGRRLAAGDYRLVRVVPFDMFPQTYHIESASLWIRES